MSTAAPPDIRAPQRAKLDAIDYAVEYQEIRSFADLGGIGRVFGQYAFYTIDQPAVQRGLLVDLYITDWVEQESLKHPGLETIREDFTDPAIVASIGEVDTVILFDVLLHMVNPDWDQLLEAYAPRTKCFIIANPQWERGEQTIRLLELGREGYLNTVPPTSNHNQLWDRLDEWISELGRTWRDANYVWQWAITDRDLSAKMTELGFNLKRYESGEPFWNARGFVNRTFVFAR